MADGDCDRAATKGGDEVAGPPPAHPAGRGFVGGRVRIEPLETARHGSALVDALAGDGDRTRWRYFAAGAFADATRLLDWLEDAEGGLDPDPLAVVDAADGRARGVLSRMAIVPAHRRVEIGSVAFGVGLARTAGATEALRLVIGDLFDLGYRRVEWKCDARHAASRRAAERLGFVFEGVFRRHMVIRGASRDTAWYALTDDRWPVVAAAMDAWLDPANFDASGRQRTPLRVPGTADARS